MTSYLFKNMFVCFCSEIKTGAEMLELDVCHVVCRPPPPRSRTDSGRHLEKSVCSEFSSFCGAVTDRPCNRSGLAVGLRLIFWGHLHPSVSVCAELLVRSE